MSAYRLCQIRQADTPYYIENISTNVYTVEELCYYMYHNIALLDATFVGTGLTRWLAQELGMKNTALAMEKAFLQKKSLAGFLMPVFEETGYLTPQEMQEYRTSLDRLLRDAAWSRMKKKGDALVRYGKYVGAIRSYRQALDMVDLLDADESENREVFEEGRHRVQAEIWHNIGVADMRMLDYEEGTAAFRKARELDPTRERRDTWLLACAIVKPEAKFREMLKEEGVTEEEEQELRQRMDMASSGRIALPEDPAAFVDLLTVRYHISTGT